MITLTALIVLGKEEELAMHLRAALRNGLSVEKIREVLLQRGHLRRGARGQPGVRHRAACAGRDTLNRAASGRAGCD